MNTTTSKELELNGKPISLSQDFDVCHIDAEHSIRVERGPHFLIEFPIETRLPAAHFLHRNIARTVARKLSYKYDNPKRWVEKDGTCHFFVIPREHITLLPERGYSWPHGQINGAPIRFNCSGGTGGRGWQDYLGLKCSVNTNYGVRTLAKVAAIAIRGSAYEPIKTSEELTEEFYTKHGNDWLVTAAWGDWQGGVPDGMVGVCARIGGHRAHSQAEERWFLVPKDEYGRRDYQFVIDPARHLRVDDFSHLPHKQAKAA